MLGTLMSETRGKRIVRRVLSTEPVKVEVSFEDGGKLLGIDCTGFGTYQAVVSPDGTLYGEGEGVSTTKNGEMASWKGSGRGRLKPGGAVSYRGILYFSTASEKLAQLNTVAGIFEYEVDKAGKTHSKVWEWK